MHSTVEPKCALVLRVAQLAALCTRKRHLHIGAARSGACIYNPPG